MAQDGSIPELYTDTDSPLVQHAAIHTGLLHRMCEQLKGIPPASIPFRLQISKTGGAIAKSGSPLTSASRGEILTVQNPTNAPILVTLQETNGSTVLSVSVAANDYKALYVPFFDRLWAIAGDGMIISGKVYN